MSLLSLRHDLSTGLSTCAILAAVVALSQLSTAVAQETRDEPSNFPTPDLLQRDWQFDFKYAKPKLIAVSNSQGQTQWFWYMTYTVTNETGEERIFLPEIVIATDLGHIVNANVGVPDNVFAAIKEREQNPLLEKPVSITGPILQGEDMARDGVAVWQAFDPEVAEMSIFIAGLSGETHVVMHPLTDERIILLRTLMVHCSTPGRPAHVQDQTIASVTESWVVR